MKTYIFIFSGALLLSLLFTPLIIFIARALNIYDDPDARKVHARAVPRIGGVAIFAAAMIMSVSVLAIDNAIGRQFYHSGYKMLALLAGGTLMFAVGLIDDLCQLRARHKFIVQIVAALLVCWSGGTINTVSMAGVFTIHLGWLAWPLTVLWIAGITNAVNFIDGLDGLAGGIAFIACGVVALLAIYTHQAVMAVLMLAMLGALTGFLAFNFNPARVFMGDSGSLFLGFMLGAGSVVCASKSATLVGLALPFLALGVPIFDMLFSMLRRILERRSMFAPDRGHIHHRLLAMGLHHRHVVIFIYLITLLMVAMGMFMMITRAVDTILVFFCVVLLLVLVFRIVGAVRLRETISRTGDNINIVKNRRFYQRKYDAVVLVMRNAVSFGDWWQGICEAAGELDLTMLATRLHNRDGSERTFIWRNENHRPDDMQHLVQMNIPIRQRRACARHRLRLEAAGPANGSLELAGYRLCLFSRLVNEYNPATLPEDNKKQEQREFRSRNLELKN